MADEPEVVPQSSPAPPPRREWRFPASADYVPSVRRAVRAFGEAHRAAPEALSNLALAVTEAVTNAVLHAYVGRGPGEVLVVVQAAPDELVVCVFDDGRGMQPRPDSPGLGMGLPMIGQLTTSVDIRERPAGGTEVRMRFAAPGVRGPAPATPEGDARLQLLVEVGRLAQAGGWPHEGVGRLVHLLVPALADACVIERVQGARLERLAHAGMAVPELDQVPAGGGVEVVDMAGGGWWVHVPLRDADRTVGLLRLGLDGPRGRPDAQDVVFLEALGERAARGLVSDQVVADLTRTRARVERILDSLGEAVTVNDATGRTVWANAAAAALLGAASVDEVLRAAPGELAARFVITGEDGGVVSVEDLPGNRLLAGRDAPPLLTRSVHRATGVERWLLTKATLLDEDGERLAVNIIEDVTEATRAQRRATFLARAGEVLGRSLDPERTLHDIAALMVPHLADWCAIDLVGEDGALARVAIAHADPELLAFAEELERRYPSRDVEGEALRRILDGGPPLLVPELTDEMLAGRARDEEELRLLRAVGMRSVLLLPLRVEDRTIGVLNLITAESRRSFSEDDLDFGAEVARRAAVAVENARRFTELA